MITTINIVSGLIETLLGLRIVLKFLNASTISPFVNWIYETTDPLLKPFIGMFPSPEITNGFIIEFSSLFAITTYAIIGYLIAEIVISIMNYDQ